ncbi:SDR family NAD(P)-dependent oxidoreductase, partial [bacterium]|nr:SDR family NAD(P)-dependent oxidoreductase [bacterium]
MITTVIKKTLLVLVLCQSCAISSDSWQQPKKAIVIGASSSMGRQVAKLLGNEGEYEVGLVARRRDRLESLSKEITSKTYIKCIDVSEYAKARNQLEELIDQMGGIDLMLISISAT